MEENVKAQDIINQETAYTQGENVFYNGLPITTYSGNYRNEFEFGFLSAENETRLKRVKVRTGK